MENASGHGICIFRTSNLFGPESFYKSYAFKRYLIVEADNLAHGYEMGKKPFDIPGPEPARMGLAAEVMDIAEYPLAIGLLGAIRVMMIPQHFSNLIHELKPGIGTRFRLFFF